MHAAARGVGSRFTAVCLAFTFVFTALPDAPFTGGSAHSAIRTTVAASDTFSHAWIALLARFVTGTPGSPAGVDAFTLANTACIADLGIDGAITAGALFRGWTGLPLTLCTLLKACPAGSGAVPQNFFVGDAIAIVVLVVTHFV